MKKILNCLNSHRLRSNRTGLQIFDRWGNQVYNRNGSFLLDESQGWDGTFRGKPLPIGPYIYFFRLIKEDGTSEIRSGEINIIR
ncbi:MAG: hypothetical protein F6K19_46175 [Cyanothece sp. SIO1E1]|nr:hypothetical protein [Cyanothece sp. SIO1E1]